MDVPELLPGQGEAGVPLKEPLWVTIRAYPRDLRTHKLRLLGPKTILYKAVGFFARLTGWGKIGG